MPHWKSVRGFQDDGSFDTATSPGGVSVPRKLGEARVQQEPPHNVLSSLHHLRGQLTGSISAIMVILSRDLELLPSLELSHSVSLLLGSLPLNVGTRGRILRGP